MSSVEQLKQRVGILVKLIENTESLGRTAIMKLMFFLQEVKEINLGYQFRIYTYGPFDSSVLEDISYAESLGIINSETEVFQSGYSYKYKNNSSSSEIINSVQDFINNNESDIKWVCDEFGSMTASELELLSTIVYVDRMYNQNSEKVEINAICEKVKKIKSHFTTEYIFEKTKELYLKELLKSII